VPVKYATEFLNTKMGHNTVGGLFKELCATAGTKAYTSHSLRASFVSYAHDRGYTFADIAHRTGHCSEPGMAPYRTMQPSNVEGVQVGVRDQMLGKRKSAEVSGDMVENLRLSLVCVSQIAH
jgi:integrase